MGTYFPDCIIYDTDLPLSCGGRPDHTTTNHNGVGLRDLTRLLYWLYASVVRCALMIWMLSGSQKQEAMMAVAGIRKMAIIRAFPNAPGAALDCCLNLAPWTLSLGMWPRGVSTILSRRDGLGPQQGALQN
ncbi:hypothetical protein J6590_006225 [Homalodisca vitripennis]|nr:hypothetical protein J6590_006225 [Homalodisca vitripennis]